MCYEERVLYRLFSGLHTSTNIHINWMYYPPRKGVRDAWAPNPARFMKQYGEHAEWTDNLYFAYVVLLRAVKKSSHLLEHNDFDVGVSQAEVRPWCDPCCCEYHAMGACVCVGGRVIAAAAVVPEYVFFGVSIVPVWYLLASLRSVLARSFSCGGSRSRMCSPHALPPSLPSMSRSCFKMSSTTSRR
jgi:hypothetical protein